MASIRNKKKGSGFLGDLIKSGVKLAKDEVVGKLPVPEFLKEPIKGLAD
jgi:hypothetical protein